MLKTSTSCEGRRSSGSHGVIGDRNAFVANGHKPSFKEFQNDEIKALLKKLGKKRVLLTDDQRHVLVVKGREFGAGPRA